MSPLERIRLSEAVDNVDVAIGHAIDAYIADPDDPANGARLVTLHAQAVALLQQLEMAAATEKPDDAA